MAPARCSSERSDRFGPARQAHGRLILSEAAASTLAAGVPPSRGGTFGVVHSHSHAHAHAHPDDRSGSRRALSIALGLTVAYGVVQIVTGIWFNSLALIADAVHNVSDGGAIALALGAAWAAGLPARGARTFGWRRAEILAALVNGLALVVISFGIFYEAYSRYSDPPDVAGLGVLVVGLVGVVANGIPVLVMLRASAGDDLNLRGAIIHAATDVVGSAGAAASGLIVLTTGWRAADPVIGAAIGLIVLVSSWGLIRESLRILMEVAPGDCDPSQIGQAMADHPGVKEVHDLHIWTITSGFPALSAHVIAEPGADHDRILHDLEALVQTRFQIGHTTLQIDRDHSELVKLRPRAEGGIRRTAPLGTSERTSTER
jgi:cobalt-zinc-cadmium efflux system protein